LNKSTGFAYTTPETTAGSSPAGSFSHQEEIIKKNIRVTALVGSYRKGGVIDTAIDEVLAGAREEGAEVAKIYLMDRHIEFCTNCRTCTQQPGPERGTCCINDDMGGIIEEIERSDALVLGSPMNFGTVTAVMKKFIERLVCFAYWPWGMNAPKIRNKERRKRALVVASSAAPSFIARLSSKLVGLLKDTAGILGAKTLGVLFIGLAAHEGGQQIGERTRRKARLLGKKLAASCRM
jgi:NAD(P)H-dependent FMN reductase